MVDLAVAIREDQARLNITWGGQNGDLPDPVSYDSTDGDIKMMATEAIAGGFPGIDADANADFGDFVVEKFGPTEDVPYNRIFLRPKTPFGG